MRKEKWYTIPPYKKGESWNIHNQKGELVAIFENREECELVTELFNKNQNK